MTNFEKYKEQIEMMANEDYRAFVKALLSFEKDITDEDPLEYLYEEFMSSDYTNLLSEDFNYYLDDYNSENR